MVDDTRGELLHRSALTDWAVRCGDVHINQYISGLSEKVGHMWFIRYFLKLTVGYADPAQNSKTMDEVGGGAEKKNCNLQKWTLLRGKLHSSVGPWSLRFFLLISASPEPPRKSVATQSNQAQPSRSRAGAEMNHCQGVSQKRGERAVWQCGSLHFLSG